MVEKTFGHTIETTIPKKKTIKRTNEPDANELESKETMEKTCREWNKQAGTCTLSIESTITYYVAWHVLTSTK